MAIEQFVEEPTVLFWELVVDRLASTDVSSTRGDEDVHPVGRAIHGGIDPREFDLEFLGREAGDAENPESAGAAHSRGDVPAVREREIGNSMPNWSHRGVFISPLESCRFESRG